MQEVCLKRHILDKLSHHGIMAYLAVSMAGDVEATTAALAGLVRVQTGVMLSGLKELAVEAPMLVRKHKTKWWCCGYRPAFNEPVQNLESDRYRAFIDDLKMYWEWVNKHTLPFSMGGKDGAAIRGFLRDHPNWESEHWRTALVNRGRSPVSKSAPLFTWVGKLSDYAAGPLNEYGRPQEGTGKHGQAISIEQANRDAKQQLLGATV